jgi:spore germination protein YaaH
LRTGKKGIGFILSILLFILCTALPAKALDYKFNMTYIYFGSSANYSSLVDKTQDSLQEVAPNYFSLDAGGGLAITPAASLDFVREMHATGILVVPYLSNDWDREKGRAALRNRQLLADALAEAVAAYELDGVNIDIENMTPDDRSDYVDFVRLLRAKLPRGKRIAVAVAENPYGSAQGWAGSYDYAELASFSDYLMIMAYDESYHGSPPGPVSSLGTAERSIRYALSAVPKEKIVLGLPFYGRIWSSGGGYPYGYGISNAAIDKLIRDYDGTVVNDKTSRAACATVTIRDSDSKPKVNGQELPAGTYQIWYANEEYYKAALALVTKYDIKGTGSWSLGQEAGDMWSYYKLWLNGCTFSDVQTSWAKDHILTAYLNGWMNGTSAAAFSPDAPLTRAQAAAVFVRRCGLDAVKDSAGGFSDCGGSWAEAYIDTARRYGLVEGVGNNRFEPMRNVTREEIAVMLSRMLRYTDIGAPAVFPDVTEDKNAWSFEAIRILSANGVLRGYPDGLFRPGGRVTRAEVTAMLSRIDLTLRKDTGA